MRRFEKHPVITIALVLVVALAGLLAASETYLRLSESVDAVTAGESLARPERHIWLREWLPDTRFVFAPPEIRRLNPGATIRHLPGPASCLGLQSRGLHANFGIVEKPPAPFVGPEHFSMIVVAPGNDREGSETN